MERYFVYVLESTDGLRRYKGMTSDLKKRVSEHNQGHTKSTKGLRPWKLVYYEEFENREEARAREKYFKTAAGRRYLDNIIGPVVQRIE